MRFNIFLLIVFLFVSCQKRNNISKTNSISVNGIEILKDEVAVDDICVIDSLLILKNKPSGDNLFEVFSTDNFKHLVSFGKTGIAPGEFERRLGFNDQFIKKNKNYFIWVYELNKCNLHLIDLSETIKQQKIIETKNISISPKVGFQEAFVINSGKLIVGNVSNTDIEMDRLRYYNPLFDSITNTIRLFPEIAKKRNNINYLQNIYNRLFINTLGIKPDNTKLVSAMVFLDRIDVFDVKSGKLEFTIKNDLNYSSILSNKIKKVFYADIYLTDNYIYALYIKNGIDENKFYQGEFKNVLVVVYDWSGKEIKSLELDEPIFRFAVDEINKAIYGLSLNEKILKYNYEN